MSELLDPLADSLTNKMEIISTEDGISRIEDCNERLAAEWTSEDIVGLIGADVSKLFQSMSAHQTARVIRDAYLESDLKMSGVNYQTAALYVRLGMTDAEIRSLGVTQAVPVRRYRRGQAPGVTSAEALHGDADKARDKWIFPDRDFTEPEKRRLMAGVLEVAVRACWQNSVYQWGGRYYHQQKGGPTGASVTMSASRVVMGMFGKQLISQLEKVTKVWMKSAYCDDIRFVINLFKNLRFNQDTKQFEAFDNDSVEDTIEALTEYCAGEIRIMMETINPDLKFEMELESHFPDKKLPTLDTNIYFSRPEDQAPVLEYHFYEKPMKTKYVILESSAMDYSQKMQILGNDLCRRLLNTKQSLCQDVKDEIVNNYATTLLRSGYKTSSVRQILISGLRGFKNKVLRASEAGTKLHRSAELSLDARLKNKIMGKSSWFKPKQKKASFGAKKYTKKVKKEKSKTSPSLKVKSVVFVPRTPSSKLAKLLRAEEQRLAVTTGYRVKIQERSGTQLRRILCSKSPLPTIPCGRDSCLMCKEDGS